MDKRTKTLLTDSAIDVARIGVLALLATLYLAVARWDRW